MICAKPRSSKPKIWATRFEIGAFARVQLAIGHGDLEERAEQLFAHGGVVREDLHDLLGIGLEARRLAPRLVPDAPHGGGMGVGDAEDPLERVDLLAGDVAVRLRHLGREHHQGDGDGGLLGFLVARADPPDAAAAGHAVDEMARRDTQDRADGAAEGEPRSASDHLSPDAQPPRAPCILSPGTIAAPPCPRQTGQSAPRIVAIRPNSGSKRCCNPV